MLQRDFNTNLTEFFHSIICYKQIQVLIIFLTDKINILYPVSCYFSVYFPPWILTIKFCHNRMGFQPLEPYPTVKYTYPYIMFTMQFFLFIAINNNKSNKFTPLFILNFSQSIYLILHKIYFLYKCITHKKKYFRMTDRWIKPVLCDLPREHWNMVIYDRWSHNTDLIDMKWTVKGNKI